MSDYEQDLAISKALNATRDPVEMRRLLTRRKLVRAGLEFEAAIAAYERANPVRPVADSFPTVIR
jgi:hypothetical protein